MLRTRFQLRARASSAALPQDHRTPEAAVKELRKAAKDATKEAAKAAKAKQAAASKELDPRQAAAANMELASAAEDAENAAKAEKELGDKLDVVQRALDAVQRAVKLPSGGGKRLHDGTGGAPRAKTIRTMGPEDKERLGDDMAQLHADLVERGVLSINWKAPGLTVSVGRCVGGARSSLTQRPCRWHTSSSTSRS